jgi:hypothetical protein
VLGATFLGKRKTLGTKMLLLKITTNQTVMFTQGKYHGPKPVKGQLQACHVNA